MKIKNTAKSLTELREKVEKSLHYRRQVLMNTIDAITVGPRTATPVELTASPIWKYEWASFYSGIRFGEEAESIKGLRKLRPELLEKWEEEGLIERDKRLGSWRVKVLDTTDYQRP